MNGRQADNRLHCTVTNLYIDQCNLCVAIFVLIVIIQFISQQNIIIYTTPL